MLCFGHLEDLICQWLVYSLEQCSPYSLFSFPKWILVIPVQKVHEHSLKFFQIPRFILSLVSATIGFSMMAFLMVLIPLVMDNLNYSFDDIAHVLQIHSVGMFAPGIIVGWLIEKFGSPIIISIGLIIMMGANACFLVIDLVYWNFLVGMLLLGIGWNFVFVSATTMLTQTYTPAEKAKAQGANDFILFLIVSSFILGSGGVLKLLESWALVNVFAMVICACGLVGIIAVMMYERSRIVVKDTAEFDPLVINTDENTTVPNSNN